MAKSIVLDVIKIRRRKYVKITNTGYKKGNMIRTKHYIDNTAMKDYFKRYKFEGDRLLEWYLHVTSKAFESIKVIHTNDSN